MKTEYNKEIKELQGYNRASIQHPLSLVQADILMMITQYRI